MIPPASSGFGKYWLRLFNGRDSNGAFACAIIAGISREMFTGMMQWLRGASAPTGEHLFNLMAECDGLADAIRAEIERRRRSSSP